MKVVNLAEVSCAECVDASQLVCVHAWNGGAQVITKVKIKVKVITVFVEKAVRQGR